MSENILSLTHPTITNHLGEITSNVRKYSLSDAPYNRYGFGVVVASGANGVQLPPSPEVIAQVLVFSIPS